MVTSELYEVIKNCSTNSKVRTCVRLILLNLDDRRGFHLDNVDTDVLIDIAKTWAGLIEEIVVSKDSDAT
jgi:hypothetical protein